MVYHEYTWIFVIVYLKARCFNAELVTISTSNKNVTVSPVVSKFLDFGDGPGYPNFREPGRFGNSPNNYPEANFSPYGNQRRPDNGWSFQNPNQYYSGRPYRPGNYQGYQGDGRYPQRRNNYGPGFNPTFNPNYQRHPYRSGLDSSIPAYPNGGMPNQGYPNLPIGSPYNNIYYRNGGRYLPQDNFQGNSNLPPAGSYPNNLNNIANPNPPQPGNDIPYPNQPSQYPPDNALGNDGNVKIRPNQNNNYPSYPSNNVPGNDSSSIRFPSDSNQAPPNKNVPDVPNNVNDVPQNQSGPGNDPNGNDISPILGKPVYVPSGSPDQPMGGGR